MGDKRFKFQLGNHYSTASAVHSVLLNNTWIRAWVREV